MSRRLEVRTPDMPTAVADDVLIAAESLSLDVEVVFGTTALAIVEGALARPGLEIGGTSVYGPLAMQAAVLLTTLARYRPLVRAEADERVVAFPCMVEFIERNGAALDMHDDLAGQLVLAADGLIIDADLAGRPLPARLRPRGTWRGDRSSRGARDRRRRPPWTGVPGCLGGCLGTCAPSR